MASMIPTPPFYSSTMNTMNAMNTMGPYAFHDYFSTSYANQYASPNTSGGSGSSGSDESMNTPRIDMKNTPRYREKRAKNNEAARKSRKIRREREQTYQKENEELKKKLQEAKNVSDENLEQLVKMIEANNKLKEERDHYRNALETLQCQMATMDHQQIHQFSRITLGDVTNKASSVKKEEPRNYQSL